MKRGLALSAVLSMSLVAAGCGGETSPSGSGDAAAQFPTDTVTVTVPYAPGGAADTSARAVAPCMERELGETVVVEYQDGASGAVAYEALKNADADGHELVLAVIPTFVLNYLTDEGVQYTAEEFQPLGLVSVVPAAFLVPANSPYETMEEFAAAARKNPGELSVATPGARNTQAAETQRLISEHDVPVTIVPFDGNSEIHPALLGGNVDAAFINTSPDTLAQIDSGKERALAVGTEERLDYIEAPTFKESGFEGVVNSSSTFYLASPAGTPEDVVGTLESTLETCSSDEGVIEALDNLYDIEGQFLGADEMEDLIQHNEEAFAGLEFEQ